MSTKDQGSVDLISLSDLLSDDIGGEKLPISDLNDTPVDKGLPDLDDKPINVESISKDDEVSSLKDNKDNADDDDSGDGDLNISGKQPVPTPEVSTYFRESLRTLFNIEKIVQADENGEDVEVSIDDIDIDQETFNMLVKQSLEEQKQELLKDKISIEGVSDFTKELLEIERNGGDASKLLEIKQAFVDPLDQLDLTQRQDQIDAIYMRMKANRQSDEDIKILIKGYEAEGILEDKARQADSELREAVAKKVEFEKAQAEETARKREEDLKAYKKNFKEVLTNKFQLNDTMKSKLVDFTTKKGKDGQYEIDQAYRQAIANPEVASELVLFLYNREEFLKQVTNKKVTEKQLETAKTIRIIRGNGGSSTKDPLKSKKEDLIDLSTLS